jgi:hypothetical protein
MTLATPRGAVSDDAPRYPVCFDSTDDADLDAETSLLEDDPMSLAEIQAACERYRVRARYQVDGETREFVPENERRVPVGE